jgi:cobalamin biosynthesis Co2+ chelatase CbiK
MNPTSFEISPPIGALVKLKNGFYAKPFIQSIYFILFYSLSISERQRHKFSKKKKK